MSRLLCCIALLVATTAAAMDFKVVGDQLIMSGGIDGSELAKLRDIAAEHGGEIRTVVLRDSPGGDLWTSLRVGEYIRERGWRTAVSGICFSGCALMYLSGVSRHFTDDKPVVRTQLGFHATYHVADSLRGNKGAVHADQTQVARDWMTRFTDGKISPAMLDRFEKIAQTDFLHFFDSNRLQRKDGVSIFTCPQQPDAKRKYEPVPGFDVYREGIATSMEVLRSNDLPARAASPAGSAATPPAPAK